MSTGSSAIDPTAALRTRVPGDADQSHSQRGVWTGASREPQPLVPGRRRGAERERAASGTASRVCVSVC